MEIERERERDRAARAEGREISLSRLLRDEPTTVFCSRELRFRSLPLAPVFPLALPLNPHVLIFPGISALTLRLCKGLYRGVDRSSCSSTYPEIRRLYYAPNFVFSAVNSDRAISDLDELVRSRSRARIVAELTITVNRFLAVDSTRGWISVICDSFCPVPTLLLKSSQVVRYKMMRRKKRSTWTFPCDNVKVITNGYLTNLHKRLLSDQWSAPIHRLKEIARPRDELSVIAASLSFFRRSSPLIAPLPSLGP